MANRPPLPLAEPGVLIVGVDASPPPPMQIGDPGSHDFRGFEVDLVREVAARLGTRVRYKKALWIDLLDHLANGQLDVICSAATITEDRRRNFDFSTPYLAVELAIVTTAGSPIKETSDFSGRTVGVRIATTAEELVKNRTQPRMISTYHMNDDAYAALAAGEIDAVVDDSPIAKAFVSKTPALRLAGTIESTASGYGMMLAPGKTALLNAINEALGHLQAHGRSRQLYRLWFPD